MRKPKQANQQAEWKTKQDQTNWDGSNTATTDESEQLP